MKVTRQTNFPSTYQDFEIMFPDEASCVAYLEQIRWPNGFVCPVCQQPQQPWKQSRGRLVCPACNRQCTVTAGTIFDKTRTPLKTWFTVAWHITTADRIVANQLERTMGISYHVAWHMLHRFRVAMAHASRKLLSGEVHVDEMMIGGIETGGKRGRGTDKSIVVIALKIPHYSGNRGQIRVRSVPDVSDKSLETFVRETISPGSVLCTDGLRGYLRLSYPEYEHRQSTPLYTTPLNDPGGVKMPKVRQVALELERWLFRPRQRSFTKEHLQSYLEEFTFRFNCLTIQSHEKLFRHLLKQSVSIPPVTQENIQHGYDWNTEKQAKITGAK